MGKLINSSRGVLGLFFMLLLLGGCYRPPVQQITNVKDSIIYKVKDTTYSYTIPGEPLILTNWIECDSVTNKPQPLTSGTSSSKKSGSSNLSIDLDASGRLTVSAQCDSLLMVVKQLEKEVLHYKDSKEAVTVPKFKTSKIDIYCRWFTGLTLLLAALIIIYKLRFP